MTESLQLIFGVLALVAVAVGLIVLAARFATLPVRLSAAIAGVTSRFAMWLIAAIGIVATLGSLYFSEIADMVPCRLCWFQRVFMYPIGVVAVIAAWRADRSARWYTAALAAVGLAVSSYHVMIEWRPELDTGSCELFGPACTVIYFRTFGFLSLATMAWCGFFAVLVISLVNFSGRTGDPVRE